MCLTAQLVWLRPLSRVGPGPSGSARHLLPRPSSRPVLPRPSAPPSPTAARLHQSQQSDAQKQTTQPVTHTLRICGCVCVYANHLFDLPVRTPSGQQADGRNGEQVHPLRYHLNPPTDIALSPPHKEVTIATTPNPRSWLHPPAAVPVLGSWVNDAF